MGEAHPREPNWKPIADDSEHMNIGASDEEGEEQDGK
jgi:hypothetical protein